MMKKLEIIVENLKGSRNPWNVWCSCQHHSFSRSFVLEYHLPFAAIFSVPDRTEQFKIGNKH